MTKYKYPLAVLAAAFLWSTSYVISKATLDYFPPANLALIRMVIMACLLAAMLVLWKKGTANNSTLECWCNPKAGRARLHF
ncbi:MAG: EamA family transporter [Clostridia bacterium]|jgi:drug/metabolite transporter (DMT)-like permease|nr:EamA family transporter [Clostridia bacterium]